MRNLKSMSLPVMLLAALVAVFGASEAEAQEIGLGTRMPAADVALQDVEGQRAQLMNLRGDRGTVVVFWSNECPWVAKYEDRLMELAEEYAGQGFSFVLVNANDPVAFPKEGAAESRRVAQAGQYSARYFLDPTSELARAFGATRTPHIYLFGTDNTLVYVGAIDDSPGDPGNVQRQYLREALDAVRTGARIPTAQTKAFGCTVKLSSQ